MTRASASALTDGAFTCDRGSTRLSSLRTISTDHKLVALVPELGLLAVYAEPLALSNDIAFWRPRSTDRNEQLNMLWRRFLPSPTHTSELLLDLPRVVVPGVEPLEAGPLRTESLPELRVHESLTRAISCWVCGRASERVSAEFFSVVMPVLDERQRRVVAGATARMVGRGGVTAVAEAASMSRNTVITGTARDRLGPSDGQPAGAPGGRWPQAVDRQGPEPDVRARRSGVP